MATPIERAQARQNFMPAMRRPACRNCAHVLEHVDKVFNPPKSMAWQCRMGSFQVTAMAVCERHELRK